MQSGLFFQIYPVLRYTKFEGKICRLSNGMLKINVKWNVSILGAFKIIFFTLAFLQEERVDVDLLHIDDGSKKK